MNKDIIKSKVREAINMLVEAPESKKLGNTGKRDYADVKRALEKIGAPSMVDVMKLTGIPDDKTGVNRSLFSKKVRQKRNPDTGSFYQFDDKELSRVRTALNITK